VQINFLNRDLNANTFPVIYFLKIYITCELHMSKFLRYSFSTLKQWPSFLTAAYIIAAFSWTVPPEKLTSKPTIDAISKPFMVFFSLWQAWDMFAPNPRSEDIWVEVVFTDKEGRHKRWPLTKMIDMPYYERWQKERWRKFFNDHMRVDSESNLWQPFAEFAVRLLRDQGETPVKLDYVRWWRAAVIPVSPELRADVRTDKWNSYTFFTWNVPGDFK
jgi:hypothetical protein